MNHFRQKTCHYLYSANIQIIFYIILRASPKKTLSTIKNQIIEQVFNDIYFDSQC